MDNEKMQGLLAKYVSGEASPDEALEAEHWAQLSPENKSFMESYFIISSPNFSQVTTEVQANVWKQIVHSLVRVSVKSKIPSSRWRLHVAAAILFFVAISFLLARHSSPTSSRITFNSDSKAKRIKLIDGTEVLLAPSSKLITNADYAKTTRRIELQGSASFVVTHEDAKPLTVSVGGLSITDIGTRFSVSTAIKLGWIAVEVEEGVVKLSDSKYKSIILHAGENARYQISSGTFESVAEKQTGSLVQNEDTKSTVSQPKKIHNPNDQVTIQEFKHTNTDSSLILSQEEIEKVLGGPVRLSNSDQNKNDGLVKLSRAYRLLSNPSFTLSFELEYYSDGDAARRSFERYQSRYPAAKNEQTLHPEVSGLFHTIAAPNTYLLVIRRHNLLLKAKINQLPTNPSSRALFQLLSKKLTY
jgi:transmembrane sensor